MLRSLATLAALLLAGTAHADPVVFQASTAIPGTSMTAGGPNGTPAPWNNGFEQWGNGFGTASIMFPFSGRYTFTVMASMKAGAAGAGSLTELRLDQIPVGVGSAWSQIVSGTTPASYAWSSYVTAGLHQVAVSSMNRGGPNAGSLLVQGLSISSEGASASRTEPPGSRDPWLQPYSSFSLWNTAIGSGAQWSAPEDADTVDVHSAGGINAGQWSMPFYLGSPTDPQVMITVNDPTYPLATQYPRLPAGASYSPPEQGGDHHLIAFSPDKKTVTHFFGCKTAKGGFACGQSQRDSVCGDGLGGYGWGAGVIRRWELEAGAIRHVLRFALPVNRTKAGDTWVSGLAWPAMRSDYNGPAGLYTGHVLYGSTIGIPAGVDITALGLSPAGLVLARALQDYGAIQRDTGGSSGVIFYAEQAAEGLPQLDDMRADMARIVPVMAVMRNQGPDTIQGGGTPRQPALPGISRAICPG